MRKLTFEEYKNELLSLFKKVNNEFRNNNITWFAHSGTLLGAKRNGEFIPWDDDIDMGMTSREFYMKKNKIVKISNKLNLNVADKIEHIGLNNSRLISNEKITVEYEGQEYITSLFIDIMIAIPFKGKSWIRPIFWYLSCRVLQIFSTFWRPLPKYKATKKGSKKINWITQLAVFIARLFIFPILILHLFEKRLVSKSLDKNYDKYVFHYGWSNQKISYSKESLENLNKIVISGETVFINDNWEYELTTRYGKNFLMPPSASARIPHHITLTPFNGNSNEYDIFPHIIR